MFSRRYLAILPILLLIAAVTVRISGDEQVWVDLAPVPYEMKVPADIAERITVEDQAGDKGEGFMKQAFDDGAIGVVALSYQPVKGEKTWFMGAYYFVEADLDKTRNPDEVPPYGFKVITRDGMALSVVGPQDSIFEPMSQDGKNITKLYDILYEAKSYRFVG
jgi:hypothetical protein